MESANSLRSAIEEIADQLCLAVDGDFSHRVCIDSNDTSVEQLQVLINFVLDAARRSLSAMEEVNAGLLRQKEQIDAARIEAEAANRAKSEFLASVSHELRTPLTAIIGFSEVLTDALEVGEQRDAAATIRKNGAYLLEVINDILDLAKVESGRLELETTDCEVIPLVEDVVSLMRVRAAAKKLGVRYVVETDVPTTIRTDPLRLRQILINLVGNGIKFTEKGEVRIVVRRVPPPLDQIECDVIDTGIGIPRAAVDTLFTPFTQADSSMSRKFGGTGLGLTICRRLACLLGGDVFVHETERGVGTTMRLRIRASLHAAKATSRRHAVTGDRWAAGDDSGVPTLEGLQLLLVEDGPDNRKLISHVLKGAGAAVKTAENGQIGRDLALAARDIGRPFDAIVMDIQMPVMDGYTAVRALRQQGCLIPVVALTAHAMAGDREKCIDAGCDDYATKPIDRHRLIRLVRSLVDQCAAHATG